MSILATEFGPVGYTDDGSGPALVFVHGFLFDRRMWRRQIESFTAIGYRVICVDMVGFGDSAVAGGPIAMGMQSRAVLAVLDDRGIDQAVLVGYSMGGQVVLDLLTKNPERASAAVFSDTFAGLDSPEVVAGRLALADRLETEGVHKYAEEFLPLVLSARTVHERPEVAAHARAMMAAAHPMIAAAALRGRAARPDYTETARTLDIPTLVLAGAEDVFDRGVLAAELAALIPAAQLAIIPEAGHTPSMETPDVFDSVVREFLERHSGEIAAQPPVRHVGDQEPTEVQQEVPDDHDLVPD
ncbi:alpha/beta fold hydrolase [Nocardia macrotermitis]|uniref:AB hydrolase superfamily protein YdjP n=1 Tax=Nocardia macrotermitis TaxID=2585198 RepID=A0A7K0D6P0_9NOCA|nr:alpha/beta hydrolase [Nocardia macrotermitis]MQY21413.1 AB hydrolase superfamily protein YdjP [Nocardia macrotermitis]